MIYLDLLQLCHEQLLCLFSSLHGFVTSPMTGTFGEGQGQDFPQKLGCTLLSKERNLWAKVPDIWSIAFFHSQSEFSGRGYFWRLFSCPFWKGEDQDTAAEDADVHGSPCQAGWTQAASALQAL